MPYPLAPITITASATVNRRTHAGGVPIILSAAAGLTITLPASTGSGDVYKFVVGTTVSSNNDIIQVANASDVMAGAVTVSSDIAGVTCPTTSTSDTITMNGTTKGGIIGSTITLTDVKANVWLVEGFLVASGTEATPFSAAVS